jgi:hypothetical protein
MDHVNLIAGQPSFVSYAMFVDRHGQLADQEVCENKIREQSTGFRKEDALIPESDSGLSEKQREDLRKDLVFKMFLGKEEYKEEVAIPFHKAFWGHKTKINNLELKTAPIDGNTLDSRKIDPDVVWQDPDNGNIFLTEMQRNAQPFYAQRISLYGGKTFATLAVKGSAWNFDLVSAFVLGLANFDLNREGPMDYIHEYASINVNCKEDFLTGQDWKMLTDLKKARAFQPEVFTERDKWIFLLNNFHHFDELENMPAFMLDGSFDKVLDIANKIKREKMDELMDFISELHQGDRERAAKEEGIEEGMEKGLEKGMEKGMEKGIVTAIRAFIAQNSTENRMSPQKIAAMFNIDELLAQSIMTT